MTERQITMRQKEVNRLQVIQALTDKRPGQVVVARQLGLSVRQI